MNDREAAARRRADRIAAGDICSEPECGNARHGSDGLCKTHHNRATGNGWNTLVKDPERERSRLRLKTHRRKDWSRLTDITPEFEMGLRAKAKRCPLCAVKLVDTPYLPNSKELDHIVPRCVGGTHTAGNVRITCRACNLARPKDGSDYVGPVTLWAQGEPMVTVTARAARRCEHGVPPSGRCYDCEPKRPTRAADGQRAAELRAEGMAWNVIAARLSFSTVSNAAKAARVHGSPDAVARWPAERRCRLCGGAIPPTGKRGRPRKECLGPCVETSSLLPPRALSCVDCGDPVLPGIERCPECWVEVTESDVA